MQKQVTLNPGKSQEVSFLVAPTIQDIYSVQLNGLAGTFEATEGVPFDPWIYDTNGDCYIDISEQLVAIDDYVDKGLITIDQLNEVIYLYTNNIKNPACLQLFYSPYGTATPYRSKEEMISAWVSNKNLHPGVPNGAFPPSTYKGPIQDFTCWNTYKNSTRCPICKAQIDFPEDTDYYIVFSAIYDHIEQVHPDFPWYMPKGGIAFADFVHDRWGLEGLILRPGHHTGVHQLQWIGVHEVGEVAYDVTLPNWGDRVYINIDTGEAVLVTWGEITGS